MLWALLRIAGAAIVILLVFVVVSKLSGIGPHGLGDLKVY
jgi:hypothetical protein